MLFSVAHSTSSHVISSSAHVTAVLVTLSALPDWECAGTIKILRLIETSFDFFRNSSRLKGGSNAKLDSPNSNPGWVHGPLI